MDRRGLIVSITGLAVGSACTARVPSADAAGKPPLAIEPQDAGRWRIRSWQWRDEAWRPAIAHAVPGAGGFEISGEIAMTDRAEVVARLQT
jgi:hypothetical protein